MIHAIIIPAAIATAANTAAHAIGIDPEGVLSTLSVPLVPADGPADAEPTHWAACGRIPESARIWLEEHQDQFPGALWWRWDDQRGLVASHDGSDLGKFWDWDNCLTLAGLKRRFVTP